MKLTSSISALVAILGIALASIPVSLQAQTTTAAPAATTTAPAPAAASTKAKKAKPTSYEGNLTAIDTTANTVTVASSAKVLTLAIAPTTTFLKDGKKATMADFAIGDKVTGSYTKDATTGVLTAHSLHKGTSAKKAAKTATTPAPAATPAAAPAPAAPAAPAAQ